MVARRRMDRRGRNVGFALIDHGERIELQRTQAVAVAVPVAIESDALDLIAQGDPQPAADRTNESSRSTMPRSSVGRR